MTGMAALRAGPDLRFLAWLRPLELERAEELPLDEDLGALLGACVAFAAVEGPTISSSRSIFAVMSSTTACYASALLGSESTRMFAKLSTGHCVSSLGPADAIKVPSSLSHLLSSEIRMTFESERGALAEDAVEPLVDGGNCSASGLTSVMWALIATGELQGVRGRSSRRLSPQQRINVDRRVGDQQVGMGRHSDHGLGVALVRIRIRRRAAKERLRARHHN